MKTCGCGGEIEQGVGCLAYLDGDRLETDVLHEGMMRGGGMGFATQYDSHTAMMSAHLQANGLGFEEASAILQNKGRL